MYQHKTTSAADALEIQQSCTKPSITYNPDGKHDGSLMQYHDITQGYAISIAKALEIPQSFTKP